jgi:hypothetical protein
VRNLAHAPGPHDPEVGDRVQKSTVTPVRARKSDTLAAQAKGVSLCFLQGAGLPDPKGILRGSGNVVRNIQLDSAATLDRPELRALMKAALDRAKTPMDPKGAHRLTIRSISAKQRPRRPKSR